MPYLPRMVKLPDPQRCKVCGKSGHVIGSRMVKRMGRGHERHGAGLSYRWRRYACTALGCRYRWTTFETLIDPAELPEKFISLFN